MFGLKAEPPEHGAHLLGHARQARHQDLERRRVQRRHRAGEERGRRSGPGRPASRRPPRSCSRARTARPARPPPAGRTTGRSATSSGAGPVARARSATTSTGAPGRSKPLRRRCSAGKDADVGHGQLVALPGVAAVDGGGHRGAGHRPPHGGTQLGQGRLQAPVVGRGGPRPDGVPLHGRRQQPDRRQDAGAGRHDHHRHVEGVGQGAGVQRPGAAEGHQGQAPGVDAPGHRHGPQRPLHGRVDHRHHARRPSTPARASAARAAAASRAPSPGKAASPGIRPSDEVGVGHRRLLAPPAVAGRARARPRPTRARPPGRRRCRCGRRTPRRRRWCGCRGWAAGRAGRPPRAGPPARGRPSRIRQTSVLVPPMSKLRASGQPQATATADAARTPPAGPESSRAAGTSTTSAAGTSPPALVITSTSPASPVSRRRYERSAGRR